MIVKNRPSKNSKGVRGRYALLLLFMVTVFSLIVSGCGGGGGGGGGGGPAPTPSPTPTETPGNVTGVVTDTDDAAISGATVQIGTASTTTAADGGYTLNDVPSGPQTITAVKDGFQNYSSAVDVPQGGTVTKNITMDPVPPTSGTVSGTVNDPDISAPVEGATVTIETVTDITDSNGEYTLNGVPEKDTKTITVKRLGYRDVTDTVNVTAGQTTTKDFNLDALPRVVFVSAANNLVNGDDNVKTDIFMQHRGQTTRVSVGNSGEQGNGNSSFPDISTNGQYLCFTSASDNFFGTVAGRQHVYLRDLNAGTTVMSSLNSGGNEPNDDSSDGSISTDGNDAVFTSFATDIVAAPGVTALRSHIYSRDLGAGTNALLSINAAGNDEGDNLSLDPWISDDGSNAVFWSFATNLVAGGTIGAQVFSRANPGGPTILVSSTAGGVQGDFPSFKPAPSNDGTYVAFESDATNLVPGLGAVRNILVKDTGSGAVINASPNTSGNEADDNSISPSISSNGTKIAFESDAADLVNGDNNGVRDIFVYDTSTATMTIVSVNSTGNQGNGPSRNARISADGRYVVFSSEATNLVPNDNNGLEDVFIHDLQTGETYMMSKSTDEQQGNGKSTVCTTP